MLSSLNESERPPLVPAQSMAVLPGFGPSSSRILPKCTKDSWVSCQRSWPRSKIMAAKFLSLAQDSRLPGQDSCLPGQDYYRLPGQDSCLPGQDSCLPGQDSCLPGQDSCLPGQDSCPFYPHDQPNIKLLSVHVWHDLFS